MALTLWADTRTGQRLNRLELEGMRRRARRVYEVNSHIFEDEVDALTALGVVAVASRGATGALLGRGLLPVT